MIIFQPKKKIDLLSKQIYSLTRDESFKKTSNMGGILKAAFDYVLKNYENRGMLNVD